MRTTRTWPSVFLGECQCEQRQKASGANLAPTLPALLHRPRGQWLIQNQAMLAPSPNRFGFMGGVEQTKMSGKGRGNNYEAKKMAWELREARLEEELDEAQQQNSELRGQLGRLEKELIKARESVAHHRQKAVEARLELQEMKGTYKANGSIGHLKIILTSKFTHTHTTQSHFFIKGSSSLRASRLRRSAKLEEEKKIEERNFTMPTKKKRREERQRLRRAKRRGAEEVGKGFGVPRNALTRPQQREPENGGGSKASQVGTRRNAA